MTDAICSEFVGKLITAFVKRSMAQTFTAVDEVDKLLVALLLGLLFQQLSKG